MPLERLVAHRGVADEPLDLFLLEPESAIALRFARPELDADLHRRHDRRVVAEQRRAAQAQRRRLDERV